MLQRQADAVVDNGYPHIRPWLGSQAITRRMLTLAEDLVAARERAGLLDEPKANGQPQPVSTRTTVPDRARALVICPGSPHG